MPRWGGRTACLVGGFSRREEGGIYLKREGIGDGWWGKTDVLPESESARSNQTPTGPTYLESRPLPSPLRPQSSVIVTKT